MKPPTPAPFFACLYPGLCDVARRHGYALTIHGTVTSDLDLVAIPWIDNAVSPAVLVAEVMQHLGACGYKELLMRQLEDESLVQQILDRDAKPTRDPEQKPHGRLAWNLYLDAGVKVDLSVIPPLNAL